MSFKLPRQKSLSLVRPTLILVTSGIEQSSGLVGSCSSKRGVVTGKRIDPFANTYDL